MNESGTGRDSPPGVDLPGVDLEVHQEIHLPTGDDAMYAVLTVATGPGSGMVSRAVPVPDLRIRVRLMPGTRLRFLRQVFPTRLDLTQHHAGPDERPVEFSAGAWSGPDSRDYLLCLEVDHTGRPQGEDLQIAVVELASGTGGTAGGRNVRRCGGPSPVVVHWTDDPRLAGRVDPVVARYTGDNEPVGPDRTCAVCLRVSPGNARYCGMCGDVLGEQGEPVRGYW